MARFPPRSTTLASRIRLEIKSESPGIVRFRLADDRGIVLRRGGEARHIQPDTAFVSPVGQVRIGAFVVDVVRHQQILSPPAWEPGRPAVDPEDYKPVDDVLLLPDGELRIPRSPRGFSDHEVGQILAAIEIVSLAPPGGGDAAHAEYLPPGEAPGAPDAARAAEGPKGDEAPRAPEPRRDPPPSNGCDVVLQGSTFNVPPRCASCGAPQQTTLQASRRQSRWIGGSVTRRLLIPYCHPCAARAQATRKRGRNFGLVALLVATASAALGFAAPGIPLAALMGLAVAAAVGFAVVAMTALAPAAPAPPAVAVGEAVKIVSFRGTRSVLHCVNPLWGEELARANSVVAAPKRRAERFGSGALAVALLVAPAASLAVWLVAHPQVHIDNAGDVALQIWVDGAPRIVVQPNPPDKPPPAIWVAYGKHTFGYSKVGAAGPEGTVDAAATMLDDFLYNPGRTACYWLVADRYGSASVAGIAQGPQPIQEFYAFDKVNTWFGDNPQSVEVSTGESGDTRVALQRAKACMQLAEQGCDAAARERFTSCEIAARTEVAVEQCAREASCAAPGATGSGSIHPIQEAHPSAHPAHPLHTVPTAPSGSGVHPPAPAPSGSPVHPPTPAPSGSGLHAPAPAPSGSAKHP